jgi:Protein of unknown function (DUF1329)
MPKKYREDTEKYSKQVKLIKLPSGGYTVDGYVAGLPFPNPSGPDAGIKIVYDSYYNYVPFRAFGIGGGPHTFGTEDRYGNRSSSMDWLFSYKYNYLSDPGMGPTAPGHQAGGIYYVNNIVVMEPEQSKYTNDLLVYYDDPERAPEIYIFLPALRRSLRLSSAARCAPLVGTDYTADDALGVKSIQPPLFQARLLGEKKVLEIAHLQPPYRYDENYILPSEWPKPNVGKWELRDVYVLEVRRLPQLQRGYCYGKRVVYQDKETFEQVGAEWYDNEDKLWKISLDHFSPVPIPGTNGDVSEWPGGPGNLMTILWDIENTHVTFSIQYGATINSDVPTRFWDDQRWGTPAGMLQVMQ